MARRPRKAPVGTKDVSFRPSVAAVEQSRRASIPGQPDIAHMRPDLAVMLPVYQVIRDCIAGELTVKQHDKLFIRGSYPAPLGMSAFVASGLYGWSTLPYIKQYLPQPNASDRSPANMDRYRQYIDRAVFYGVTRRTLNGLIGALFLRAPVVEVPPELEALKEDATGGGVSLVQFGKQVCDLVMAYGRAGLLADYPRTNGPVTVAARKQGNIRSTLTAYPPWQVINWRTRLIGGLAKLCLVVIAETAIISDDGFKENTGEQYRVLELTADNVYTLSTWRRDADGDGTFVQFDTVTPTDANGATLDYIPFTFVGPEDNGPSVDHAPVADLAALNIAHYRNSADFEESCYWCGQPTPVFTGLTEEWVNDVLGGSVQLGSRGAVMLPLNGKAELLQAAVNSMPQEAMRHKEEQMVALGAKLIEEKRVQRTATEAGIEEASAQSVLASSGANASQAILWALQQACLFEGVPHTPDTLKFEINTELDLIKLSPESRKMLLEEWGMGAISFSEYRHNLHRSGIAIQEDEEAAAEIKANPPPQLALEQKALETAATNTRTAP